MEIKFSVVIPAFNCSDVIEDALVSVCNQSAIECIGEIIVVNDGSTDNTADVVERFKKKSCIPVILIQQVNGGVSKARNTGVKYARFNWIAFLDSDDEWYPDKIQRQIQIIEKLGENAADCLGGSFSGNQLKILWKTYSGTFKADIKQICIKNFPQPSTVIIKKHVFNERGGFDENQRYAEDGKFFLDICANYNLYYDTCQVIDFGHGKRGFGSGGLSGNMKEMYKGNLKNIAELYSKRLISQRFYYFLRIFYSAKYLRRLLYSCF